MYLFIYTSIYGCEPGGSQNYLVFPPPSTAIELFPRRARGKLYQPRFIPERPLVGISVVRTFIHGYAMENWNTYSLELRPIVLRTLFDISHRLYQQKMSYPLFFGMFILIKRFNSSRFSRFSEEQTVGISAKTSRFYDICSDWLKTTPYMFLRFSCARHWKCAVHTKWP